MTDFKVLVDSLTKGAPWAVFVAAIGAIWQLVYAYTKDKASTKEAEARYALEREKFENQKRIEDHKFNYQKSLETLRFEYEQRRWREQLSTAITIKHMEARLEDYPRIWSEVKAVAKHNQGTDSLTPASARQMATVIEGWRYSRGGLLAEDTTRDAAIAFQTALWTYDGSPEAFKRIRQARRLLRAALRADMGLGSDASGQGIIDATERRNRIREDLANLKGTLGIPAEPPLT